MSSFTYAVLRRVRSGIGTRPSDFRKDERGGISMFLLVIFILLLVMGGMSVDYQRYELARADLQDALDRGSLAAANANQVYVENDPDNPVKEQVAGLITDYMTSRAYQGRTISLDIDVQPVTGGRLVDASAVLPVDTIFLRLVGIDELEAAARSIATQSVQKIEIAMILDVTWSMTWDSQSGERKIDDLETAAKQFLDTVLNDTTSQTLVSIIPFSENVALPRAIADQYDIDRQHDYSSCIDYHEFENEFTNTRILLDAGPPYQQAQHFQANVGDGNAFGCPRDVNEVTLYSGNKDILKKAIEDMTPESWTAMYMGMKWGVGFLDPSSRPLITQMIANEELSDNFAGWPHDWTDNSAQKIIILMSDGQNTRLHEVDDEVYASETPDYWNSNDPGSDRKRVIDNENDGIGDTKLAEICTAAKAGTNVVVYTIAFEVADEPLAQTALQNCASDPVATYYPVEGVDISKAFQNIAEEIVNLKLVN